VPILSFRTRALKEKKKEKVFRCFCLSAKFMTTNTRDTAGIVDLKRYSGVWYEILRTPNWFQSDTAIQTTAKYTLVEGQIEGKSVAKDTKSDCWVTLQVHNEETLGDGTVNEWTSEAKVLSKPKNNRHLLVGTSWTWFLPLVNKANYNILFVDPSYKLAIVGSIGLFSQHMWVLARDPRTVVPCDVKQALHTVKRAFPLYDIDRISIETPYSKVPSPPAVSSACKCDDDAQSAAKSIGGGGGYNSLGGWCS